MRIQLGNPNPASRWPKGPLGKVYSVLNIRGKRFWRVPQATAKAILALEQFRSALSVENAYFLLPNNDEIDFMPRLEFDFLPQGEVGVRLKTSLVMRRKPLDQISGLFADIAHDCTPELIREAQDLIEEYFQSALPAEIRVPVDEALLPSASLLLRHPALKRLTLAETKELILLFSEELADQLEQLEYSIDDFKNPQHIQALNISINNKQYEIEFTHEVSKVGRLLQLLHTSDFYALWRAKNPDITLPPNIRFLVKFTRAARRQEFSSLGELDQKAIVLLNRLLIELAHPIKTLPKIGALRVMEFVNILKKTPQIPLRLEEAMLKVCRSMREEERTFLEKLYLTTTVQTIQARVLSNARCP